VAKIFRSIPACIRDRFQAARRPDPLDHLLQPAPATLGPRRKNPGRGLWTDRPIR
jgi:hypothetical protein